MKVVLDTNVIVSGIFFGGPPGAILQAWQNGEFVLAMSPEIFNELARVTNELASQYPGVDHDALLQNIAWSAEFVESQPFDQPVCKIPTTTNSWSAPLLRALKLSSAATSFCFG